MLFQFPQRARQFFGRPSFPRWRRCPGESAFHRVVLNYRWNNIRARDRQQGAQQCIFLLEVRSRQPEPFPAVALISGESVLPRVFSFESSTSLRCLKHSTSKRPRLSPDPARISATAYAATLGCVGAIDLVLPLSSHISCSNDGVVRPSNRWSCCVTVAISNDLASDY